MHLHTASKDSDQTVNVQDDLELCWALMPEAHLLEQQLTDYNRSLTSQPS